MRFDKDEAVAGAQKAKVAFCVEAFSQSEHSLFGKYRIHGFSIFGC